MPVLETNLRISLKNILFTTDFSPASEAALPYVQALARWYGSKVVIAHVVPPEPILAIPMEPATAELDINWQDAKRRMDAFLRSNPLPDMVHETVLQQGCLWDVLAFIIEGHQIDLLVLGTHGRDGIKKLVLGSAAEQIFRRATCPVLTVGPKAAQSSVSFESWKRILFATDFSTGSLNALPYALSFAEENQASLILLHLIPLVPLQEQDEFVARARKRLEQLLPPEAETWCKPEFITRFGFPADGILHVAEQCRADLIVMGVHAASSPKASAHLLWAIAHEVVSHAHCPLLTVRG